MIASLSWKRASGWRNHQGSLFIEYSFRFFLCFASPKNERSHTQRKRSNKISPLLVRPVPEPTPSCLLVRPILLPFLTVTTKPFFSFNLSHSSMNELPFPALPPLSFALPLRSFLTLFLSFFFFWILIRPQIGLEIAILQGFGSLG